MLRILIGLMAAFALTLMAPSPAQAVTVTLNVSRTSAPPSIPVTFSGTAAGAPTGVPVTLQRAPVGSSSWSTVKTGGSVSASDTYSLTIYVTVGTYQYRAKVGTSAYSPPKSVNGYYGRNISVPAAGAPFTFSARLPYPWVRLVKFQFSTNGTTWTTRGQATSNSTGWVGIRTYLAGTSYVRAIAPATSSLPVWVGARGQLVIGIDPVIQKILDDTNDYRNSNGKPDLALHPSLNKVAGEWAYRMHQTCTFFHNRKVDGSPTNFWELYPPGWKAAGENIAAGQSYTSVVNSWITSDPHRRNILGLRQIGETKDPNFTHIGIGYYFGPKCDGTYYVQNFATY